MRNLFKGLSKLKQEFKAQNKRSIANFAKQKGILTNTLRTWLDSEQSLISKSTHFSSQLFKLRQSSFPHLEKTLLSWITDLQHRYPGMPINRQALFKKALELDTLYKISSDIAAHPGVFLQENENIDEDSSVTLSDDSTTVVSDMLNFEYDNTIPQQRKGTSESEVCYIQFVLSFFRQQPIAVGIRL